MRPGMFKEKVVANYESKHCPQVDGVDRVDSGGHGG